MSKKKLDLDTLFTTILEQLTLCKTALKSNSLVEVEELATRLAKLGEKFTILRTNTHIGDSQKDVWDSLDREGVTLWNTISTLTEEEDSQKRYVACLRMAAFRLIEAGMEAHPSAESLANILSVASKTALSWISVDQVQANEILTCAARFEEQLSKTPSTSSSSVKAGEKAVACSNFYIARMELATAEKNTTLAEYMATRLVGNAESLPQTHRTRISTRLLDVSREFLQQGEAGQAVGWLQKALTLLPVDGDEAIKDAVLRNLGMAYFKSEMYEEAEAAIEELLSSPSSSQSQQDLHYLHLSILRRLKRSDEDIFSAFTRIISTLDLSSENSVIPIIQELRNHTSSKLNMDVHRLLLEKCSIQQGHCVYGAVDAIILSLIVYCTKTKDDTSLKQVLDSTWSSSSETFTSITPAARSASLTLLWRIGSSLYTSKSYAQAAKWFLIASHEMLGGNRKSVRKAVLCFVELEEFAKASTVLGLGPGGNTGGAGREASDWYLAFLCAVRQGLEEDAVSALKMMCEAKGFERGMLVLCTQVAKGGNGQKPLKLVLLRVLEGLMDTLSSSPPPSTTQTPLDVEALAIVRCLLRFAGTLLNPEPKELSPADHVNREKLLELIIKYFNVGLMYITKSSNINIILKDVQWLWRTAHNMALDLRDTKEEDKVRRQLFVICRDLVGVCLEASLDGANDKELVNVWCDVGFAGVVGDVFELRTQTTASSTATVAILTNLRVVKDRIISFASSSPVERGAYYVHVLRVFEAELFVRTKDWNGIGSVVAELALASQTDPNRTDIDSSEIAGTVEAIADILWEDSECPVELLHTALTTLLQTLLRMASSSNDPSSIDTPKFSRWLRAILTILLARNTMADRVLALDHIKQALPLLSSPQEADGYPEDEKMWCFSTSFNTGYECLKASSGEAKEWFEICLGMCSGAGAAGDGGSGIVRWRGRVEEAYRAALEFSEREKTIGQ